MRKAFIAFVALALVAGAALLAWGPGSAGAQGGGTIEASVTYAGAAVIEKLKINKDTEKCGTEAVIEKVVVGANKGLANAVVSVPGATGAKAVKAAIDQKGCKFVPHVVVMAPGELEIKNSDDILHNVHTYSTANASINKAQPKFKKVLTEKFDKPEVVKVQCDVHNWMQAWIVVGEHAAYSVSDDSGAFKLDNVPPGKHKVEVWHETLGKVSQEVEVKAGAPTKVTFEMSKK